MTPTLLKYQHEAVASLVGSVNKLLTKERSGIIVFQSPTGSGKTLMMAQALSTLVTQRKDHKLFSFIWAAPRKLHNQSKEKLEAYYENTRILECKNISDLSETKIGENEILFLNWESINKKGNIFIHDNERDFNLSSVIGNTIREGREIILIIDESHHTSKASNTQGLIEIMNPKITIEVSATPPDTRADCNETVEFSDVVREGMVKKLISINPHIEKEKIQGEGSDEFILRQALKKRTDLKKQFDSLGLHINPLLLIQLPDKDKFTSEDLRKEKMVESLLFKKFNITRANKKLAFYLSEDKENLENISLNDNETEVLIFKQAIALGWDCPRAYILVLFREWHSETFKIQTVGRIMRMPEQKHYKNEELNKGYVYTNVANNKIKIEETLARNYFTIYTSKRKKTYQAVDLVSYHTKRARETTRLSPSFIDIFLDLSEKADLKKKVNIKFKSIIDHIPLDATLHIEHYKTANEPIGVYEKLSLAKNTIELEKALKYFIDSVLREDTALFPEIRSVERIVYSFYRFFKISFNMDYHEKEKEIISIILHDDNRQYFKDAINVALKEYVRKTPSAENEVVENDDLWNVPESTELNVNHKAVEMKKNIMHPFYISTSESKHWKTEVLFMEFIDKNKKVDWWYRNGERDATYFAVPYKDNKNNLSFYVDFILKLNDGRIGLFDTKSGWTAKDAGPRADGLFKYIQEQNKEKKSLFGGIVIPKGGSFWTYSKSPYKWDESLRNWKILEF
jgi:type III restriction enzyme